MTGDGILLKRLPPIDARGPQELGALARAYVNRAWRWRLDPQWRARSARVIPRNVLRFGSAVKP